jgi:hypothetical protein
VKTLLLSLALSAAVPAVSATSTVRTPTDPPSYAGTWVLDMAASRNLPPFYSNVKSHRLSITQDASHLNVGVDIDVGMPQPMHLDLPYPLNGRDTTVQTTMRMPQPTQIPTTLHATTDRAGAVHITITRQLPTPGGPVTGTMQETWHLRPDGKTLDIRMVDDGPMGHRESDYVFVRS